MASTETDKENEKKQTAFVIANLPCVIALSQLTLPYKITCF